jgi:hypothetical protein
MGDLSYKIYKGKIHILRQFCVYYRCPQISGILSSLYLLRVSVCGGQYNVIPQCQGQLSAFVQESWQYQRLYLRRFTDSYVGQLHMCSCVSMDRHTYIRAVLTQMGTISGGQKLKVSIIQLQLKVIIFYLSYFNSTRSEIRKNA